MVSKHFSRELLFENLSLELMIFLSYARSVSLHNFVAGTDGGIIANGGSEMIATRNNSYGNFDERPKPSNGRQIARIAPIWTEISQNRL